MTASWVMAAMIRSAPRRHKGHVAIENLPAWHLPCGWCRDQVAYAVYGRVFQRGTRFLVDARVDEG